MKIKSFAKINLGLEIIGVRPDGYHEIRTMFQAVDLFDEMEFEPAGDGLIKLEGSGDSIPWDETNLVFKAAEALKRMTGQKAGISIRVTKKIPAGRGLGGGSSNAAMTLLVLDRLWNLNLGLRNLSNIAVDLGADVAYFLHGGLCLGQGLGEELTELEDLPSTACLIGWPDFPVSTRAAYEAFSASLTSAGNASRIKRFKKDGEYGFLENDLEAVVLAAHPEIAGLKRYFQEKGAALALMSGSGSAVFGLFPDGAKARSASQEAMEKGSLILARTLTRKDYWNGIGAGASPSW